MGLKALLKAHWWYDYYSATGIELMTFQTQALKDICPLTFARPQIILNYHEEQ